MNTITSTHYLIPPGLHTIARILSLLGPDQRYSIVQRLGVLCSKPELAVREGATSVLSQTLDKFPPEQKKGFSRKLLLDLQCAMTSLDWGVKRSSLQLLKVGLIIIIENRLNSLLFCFH